MQLNNENFINCFVSFCTTNTTIFTELALQKWRNFIVYALRLRQQCTNLLPCVIRCQYSRKSLQWRCVGVKALRIAVISTVYSTACSDWQRKKHRWSALLTFGRGTTDAGGFPAHMTRNAESVCLNITIMSALTPGEARTVATTAPTSLFSDVSAWYVEDVKTSSPSSRSTCTLTTAVAVWDGVPASDAFTRRRYSRWSVNITERSKLITPSVGWM